jgi:hypothetical protein
MALIGMRETAALAPPLGENSLRFSGIARGIPFAMGPPGVSPGGME